MTKKPYNEPAFPHPGGAGDATVQNSFIGMSMRDYFAAAALTGLLAQGNSTDRVITTAFDLADRMLSAREGTL